MKQYVLPAGGWGRLVPNREATKTADPRTPKPDLARIPKGSLTDA